MFNDSICTAIRFFANPINNLKLIVQKVIMKCESSVFERLKSLYRKDIPLFLNLSEIKEKVL